MFYFSFVVNFSSTSPLGAYIWRDDFTEGFFTLPVRGGGGGLYLEGLIHGGAYFRNFTVFLEPEWALSQLSQSTDSEE